MTDLQEMARVHYYNGQLLNAKIFDLEQSYTTRLMNYHNQTLFTPGVASGLEVHGVGGPNFLIRQGMALDHLGRQLIWPLDGPPQTIPNTRLCSNTESVTVEVYLEWQETPIYPQEGSKGDYDAVSLLPLVTFDSRRGVKIAALTISGERITGVDNSVRTQACLKAPASSQGHQSQCTETLAGSSKQNLNLNPGKPTWARVHFKKDRSQAFTAIPIVTTTAVTQNSIAYNLTLGVVTTTGFQVAVSLLHQGMGNPEQGNPEQVVPTIAVELTINWIARPPGQCTETGDGA